MRVLLVEDDANTAQTIARLVASMGHACDMALHGELAVELAMRNGYDLILLDLMLPDIDGYEVLRRLRDAQIQVPVVIQSGILDRHELEKGKSFGFEDFLIKPFSQSELADRIEKAVARDGDGAATENNADDEFERRNNGRKGDEARRRHARIRTLKSGQIIYKNASCVLDCLVVNLSEGGAALQPADFVNLPDTFMLKLTHGPTYGCEVCWRHGNKLGVRFVTR